MVEKEGWLSIFASSWQDCNAYYIMVCVYAVYTQRVAYRSFLSALFIQFHVALATCTMFNQSDQTLKVKWYTWKLVLMLPKTLLMPTCEGMGFITAVSYIPNQRFVTSSIRSVLLAVCIQMLIALRSLLSLDLMWERQKCKSQLNLSVFLRYLTIKA